MSSLMLKATFHCAEPECKASRTEEEHIVWAPSHELFQDIRDGLEVRASWDGWGVVNCERYCLEHFEQRRPRVADVKYTGRPKYDQAVQFGGMWVWVARSGTPGLWAADLLDSETWDQDTQNVVAYQYVSTPGGNR